MANIIGTNATQVFIPEFSSIPYSVVFFPLQSSTGVPTSTTGMGGYFGIRKEATFNFTPVTRTSEEGRHFVDKVGIKGEITTWQTDFFSLYMTHLLTYQYVNLGLVTANGDVYNLVENTSLTPVSAPNGSRALGMGYEYTLDGKDVSNKLTFDGSMYPTEWDWTLSGATGVSVNATAGSQVVTPSLSSILYNTSNYSIPGILSISVSGTSLTGSIGIFDESAKISIKTKEAAKDNLNRSFYRGVEIEIDGKMLQMPYYDQQYLQTLRNSDINVTVICANGITFQFNSSVSFTVFPDLKDGSFNSPFKISGKVMYDPFGVAQKNIIFNSATKTVTFNRSPYQP